MNFNEIVICEEEYQILSQLSSGGKLEYKLSAIQAPYYCRLSNLKLIETEYISDGTIDITETPLQARITSLGENYFCYARNLRKRDKISHALQIIPIIISIIALIISIVT